MIVMIKVDLLGGSDHYEGLIIEVDILNDRLTGCVCFRYQMALRVIMVDCVSTFFHSLPQSIIGIGGDLGTVIGNGRNLIRKIIVEGTIVLGCDIAVIIISIGGSWWSDNITESVRNRWVSVGTGDTGCVGEGRINRVRNGGNIPVGIIGIGEVENRTGDDGR